MSVPRGRSWNLTWPTATTPVTATDRTLSSSVTDCVQFGADLGLSTSEMYHPAIGSLTLVDDDRQVDIFQVIPGIGVGPGHAVFAAGADSDRYLVDVVSCAFSKYRQVSF